MSSSSNKIKGDLGLQVRLALKGGGGERKKKEQQSQQKKQNKKTHPKQTMKISFHPVSSLPLETECQVWQLRSNSEDVGTSAS